MEVFYFTKSQWDQGYAKQAHQISFAERLEPGEQRLDFALLVTEGPDPLGFVTCREMHSKVLYWAYGGAFPTAKGSLLVWRGYQAIARKSKELGYEQVATYIENTNSPMLKMAAKIGFKITGVRVYKNTVLLEHVLDFGGDSCGG